MKDSALATLREARFLFHSFFYQTILRLTTANLETCVIRSSRARPQNTGGVHHPR